jgi:hypothetical protein
MARRPLTAISVLARIFLWCPCGQLDRDTTRNDAQGFPLGKCGVAR